MNPQISRESRSLAILAHLSAVIGWIVSVGWFGFLGPLFVWYTNRDNYYVRQAAARSFNFNISLFIMNVLGWVLIFSILLIPLGIGVLLLAFFLMLYHHIRAAMAASRLELYHYPWQLPILD